MLELIVEPRKVKTWDQFIFENPAYSIALDGYVYGAPKYQPDGPRLNLNHHEDIERLSTFSTSMQAYVKVKFGLFDRFKINGNQPHAFIWANDPDQDSSLAAFILMKPEFSSNGHYQKKLEELLHHEQLMDISGWMFPVNINSKIVKQMAWIFEPYNLARNSKELYSMDSERMKDVMEKIFLRIEDYLLGGNKGLKLDSSYNILYRDDSFAVVQENSIYSRGEMVRDGIKAFVSVLNSEYPFRYTIGKISDFIQISLPEMYNLLNNLEKINDLDSDKWGGSNTIGGSPRQKGSQIDPEKLFEIIKSRKR